LINFISYSSINAQDIVLEHLPPEPCEIICIGSPIQLPKEYLVLNFPSLSNKATIENQTELIIFYYPELLIDPLDFFNYVLKTLAPKGSLLIVDRFATSFNHPGLSRLNLVQDFMVLAERFNLTVQLNEVLSVDEAQECADILLKISKGDLPKWRLSYLDKSDINRMLVLFKQSFHHVMSPNLWNWKYSALNALIVCIWEGDKLIGSLGGMPRQILYFGEPQTVVQIGDVMVDSSKRGILTKKGAFFHMTATFLECCSGFGKPFLFAFGFPNERHIRLAEHLKFYKEVDRIVELSWSQLLKPASFFYSLVSIKIDNVEYYSAAINALWKAMAVDLQQAIVGVRDTKYLLQRYLQHPENNYHIFIIKNKITQQIRGCMVLHIKDKRCDIIDIIGPLSSIPLLIASARYVSSTLHCARIFCQISNTFSTYFKINSYQQEATSIPIAKDTWVKSPKHDLLIHSWWLMSGDMDCR